MFVQIQYDKFSIQNIYKFFCLCLQGMHNSWGNPNVKLIIHVRLCPEVPAVRNYPDFPYLA